jgi:mannose-6-phosphate isomerase-like protein (cupin superfamily)
LDSDATSKPTSWNDLYGDYLHRLRQRPGANHPQPGSSGQLFVIEREDLTITHARYAAGEHVAGRHIHHQHTDAFYILEGKVIFEIGPEAETITVSAGGFVAAPPGLAHSFRVADTGPARWLTIHAPDGGLRRLHARPRDDIQFEWDIAAARAKGGLPADHAIISRAQRRHNDAVP